MEKLKLDSSNRLWEEALDLVPGGVLGIRRPYNFVPGEYPLFLSEARPAGFGMSTGMNISICSVLTVQ